MFVDAFGLISNAQAFTASAYSTDTIDLGNVTPRNDLGAGEPMALVLEVDVAADFTTTDETYQFDFVQSANANLSSHTALSGRVIAASLLTAGSIHVFPIPPGAVTARYIGMRATLGGTTPSVTVTAHIQPMSMIQQYRAYADGFTIS